MKNLSNLPLLLLGLGLCLPPCAGAQANVTLSLKADMSCTWKLDDQPMGQLSADSLQVFVVSSGEHLIEASTPDGEATVRTKVEVDNTQKIVGIQLKTQYEGQLRLQHAETPGQTTGADSAQSPTWTDPATGLMWTGKDNGSDVGWPEADAFCSNLRFSGHNDWRLATPEELQGIYDPGVSLKEKFDSGQTNDVHVKGNLKLTGWTWSNRQGDNPGKPYQGAWLFKFGEVPNSYNFGKPLLNFNFLHFHGDMRALCVRSSEK